jgi:predicted PhzF superfamily epimerase YddE/YHI9
MALALGLATDDIDPRYPVQVMAAGTAAVIVPLRSLAAVQRALLDLKTYSRFDGRGFPTAYLSVLRGNAAFRQ